MNEPTARHFRRTARNMRIATGVVLAGLALVTAINLSQGVEIGPWWFYLCMVSGCGLFWLITNLLIKIADRRN